MIYEKQPMLNAFCLVDISIFNNTDIGQYNPH